MSSGYGISNPGSVTLSASADSVGGSLNPQYVTFQDYHYSAFGNLRTAPPYTLFDAVNKYELDTNMYATKTAGAGAVAHNYNLSCLTLTVTDASGDSAEIRSKSHFRYQAGKGLRVLLTGFHSDTGQTNQVRTWGFLNATDGLYWQLSGTDLSIVRLTSTSGSPVPNAVAQADWNQDPLDGTGPSGVTLDLTKGNIYEISLQWLGVGVVTFYINGIKVHVMNHPNTLAAPYMRTAQLPIGWKIINNDASAAGTMYFVCSSVIAEGGDEPPTLTFAASSSVDVAVSTTELGLMAIRPTVDYPSSSSPGTKPFHGELFPTYCNAIQVGGRARVNIYLNPTVVATDWKTCGSTSAAEYSANITSFSGGELVATFFLPDGTSDYREIDLEHMFGEHKRKLRFEELNSTRDVVLVTAVKAAGGSTAMRASVAWREMK